MKIFIVGGGQVGSNLATSLVAEMHDITVIDPDERVLESIGSRNDVICYVGNGASFSVLQSAGIEDCDLMIAVTLSDEVNMLACLCAHKLGARHTVARVRNGDYSSQLYELKKDLGLTMAINPEKAAAEEIARIIRFPSASRIEIFAKGRMEMVSFKIPKDNPLENMMLKNLTSSLNIKVLVCAVDRGGELIIPDGDFIIKAGDELYITGSPKEIERALRRAKLYVNPVKNLVISGGGRITHHLCEALSKKNISLKIIERDNEKAEEMAALIPSAVVIHGDSTDEELLIEEGIKNADAYVALGDTEEGNILSSLFAKRNGVKKVIAKTDSERMGAITRELGLETSVSPKAVTVNSILRYVRAMAESESCENITSLYKILDGRAEILEFTVDEAIDGLTGITLKELSLKKNLLIAGIVRKNDAIIPGGNDFISVGDSVLVLTTGHSFTRLSDIIEG
ncbi:MAG: Trk system potassium transporter TrkA [Clostridia bacterium]|nr:Trk system potassium transporter TrkA [Clostridia bacterium]